MRIFTTARVKLTLWFLLVVTVISVGFSALIYQFLVGEVVRFEEAQRFRIERRLQYPPNIHPIPLNTELIEETKRRIMLALLLIDGTIIIASGWLGFFLAGRVLSPIEEMMGQQARFVSDASHELKTPLTALKTTLEVFLRDKSPTLKEASSLIKESVKEVDSLQTLSQSLLDLASYENPNNIGMEEVSLQSVIDEAKARITPTASKNKITVENDYTEARVMGNAEKLSQLLIILLDNAVKYSPHGGKVSVLIKKADRSVFINVVDHGMGISKEDLPHIFDRFYRSNTARNKIGSGGYGLGLAIAQKIVGIHNGVISVTSDIGKGSVFTIKLPTV